MANLLNNQKSILKNQRTAAAYKAEVNADSVYIYPVTNGEGKPIMNQYGHQAVAFVMTKNKVTVASGLVADKTAQEGIVPERAQIAESHYIDRVTGEPRVAMMLFNGMDVLANATLIEL